MNIIQVIIFLLSGIFLIIGSFGLLRFEKMPHILYARLHIIGVLDSACILSLIAIGRLNVALVAILYFILTPVAIHSIAKSHYEGGSGDDY